VRRVMIFFKAEKEIYIRFTALESEAGINNFAVYYILLHKYTPRDKLNYFDINSFHCLNERKFPLSLAFGIFSIHMRQSLSLFLLLRRRRLTMLSPLCNTQPQWGLGMIDFGNCTLMWKGERGSFCEVKNIISPLIVM
jgi:hypothetical protein